MVTSLDSVTSVWCSLAGEEQGKAFSLFLSPLNAFFATVLCLSNLEKVLPENFPIAAVIEGKTYHFIPPCSL